MGLIFHAVKLQVESKWFCVALEDTLTLTGIFIFIFTWLPFLIIITGDVCLNFANLNKDIFGLNECENVEIVCNLDLMIT